MKHTIRFSVEIDFDTPSLRVLPEDAGADFRYLDQLLDALSQLVRDTPWPGSVQGEFLDYVTRDVYEFACAIRMEAAAGRWTAAMSLIRPLQERSEYALAAAIDSSFRDTYVEYINTQIDTKFTASSRKRPLVQIARGAINRWAKESHGKDGLLETSITLNKIGSEILHHGIGFSGEAEEIVQARPWLLRMASGRVQCGMAKVMLAIKVMGGNDTDAWRRASAIVTLA